MNLIYQSEDAMHLSLCQYLKLEYPKVYFNSDMSGDFLGSGGKKNYTQARIVASKRSKKGFPDLILYHKNNRSVGLALELKKVGSGPFKKDGSYKKAYAPGGEKHEQVEWLEALYNIGFETYFAIGFDHAKYLIDDYLKNV